MSVVTRMVCLAKAFFCLGDKLRGAASHRGRYAKDHGEVRHVFATLDLAPVRSLYPHPSANFFLGFRLPEPDSKDGRAKRLGRR